MQVMGVKITVQNANRIKQVLRKDAPRILRDNIMRALARLGEECVIKVRSRSGEESWYDQTGNLRSSVGYGAYDYGKKYVESAFDTIKSGGEGSAEGQKYLHEIAEQYQKCFALVIVAGMSYAEYVEAKDSKDVLASTELWARKQVNDYIDKGIERACKQINAMLV